MRVLKAYEASLTLTLSMVGKDCKTSYGHRCHSHSRISFCIGSVNSSLKCRWTMLVRPSRFSTLSVVPSTPNFSSIGARVGGGGPCKRTCFNRLLEVEVCLFSSRQLASSVQRDRQCFPLQRIVFAARSRSKSSHFQPHRIMLFWACFPTLR